MCGNISPRRTDTCPTDVTYQVYDELYEGDGECTVGFTAAASEYDITDFVVDWTNRAY